MRCERPAGHGGLHRKYQGKHSYAAWEDTRDRRGVAARTIAREVRYLSDDERLALRGLFV